MSLSIYLCSQIRYVQTFPKNWRTLQLAPETLHLELVSKAHVYLGIQKPTVLRVLPSNVGVITYYSVGFGVTGRLSEQKGGDANTRFERKSPPTP